MGPVWSFLGVVAILLLVCCLLWMKAEDICSRNDPCIERERACNVASFFRSLIGMDPVTVGSCGNETP